MATIAIIFLIIVFLAIQHLSNWGVRYVIKSNNPSDDSSGLIIILIFLGALISWSCLYQITLWMYPLITQG